MSESETTTTAKENTSNGFFSRVRSLFAAAPSTAAGIEKALPAQIETETDIEKAPPTQIETETGIDAEIGQNNDPSGFTEYKNFDDLIKKKGYSVYRDMMKDATVSHCIYNKRVAVVESPYDILPASDQPLDIETAQFIGHNFDKMQGTLATALFQVLNAVIYGHSISEINYQVCQYGEFKGKWIIKNIRNKNPKDFAPVLDDFGNIIGLNIIDKNGVNKPIEGWQYKYIIYTYCGEFGRHFGDSDLRSVYKHWWSKDFLLKWWNVYLERFGCPTRVGKFPRGNTTAKADLLKVLKDIVNNTAIVIPDDMELEFKQAAEKGNFDAAVKYHDSEITKKILGATLTTGDGLGVGSFAMAKEHRVTTEQFIDFLRQDVEDVVVNEQIIRRLIELNYGLEVACPRFSYQPAREEIAINAVADVKTLAELGVLTNADIKILRSRMDLPKANVFEAAPDEIFKPTVAPSPFGGGYGGDVIDIEANEVDPPKQLPAIQEEDVKSVAPQKYAAAKTPITLDNIDTWKPSRELTTCELAVGGISYFAKQLKKQLTAEEQIIEGARPIFEEMKSSVMKYIESKVLVDGEVKADALNKLVTPVKQLNEFKKLVTSTVRESVFGEYESALRVVKCDKAGIPAADEAAFARTNISLEFIPPEKVKKQLKKWADEGDWLKIKRWRETRIGSISGTLETVANTKIVSYIDRRIVEGVHNAIIDGVMGGGGIKEITRLVNKTFEQVIARGEAVDPKLQSAKSLEEVTRTTVNSAFNDAHRAAWADPEIVDQYPYLEYIAIMDDATSEICESLDGKIYRQDDPIWDSIIPPNHSYCRSDTLPIDMGDPMTENGPSKQPDLSKIPESFGGTGRAKGE